MSEAKKFIDAMTEPEFIIDSDSKAEWALKKIAEARSDCAAWVAWYEEKIKQIKEQTDFDTANLEAMLARYFDTVPHKKTKTQESYALPGGKLVLKKQNAEYNRDDKTVIDWLERNGGEAYIKTEKKLDWSTLKRDTQALNGQIVTMDGEIIPGIEVTDRPDKFVVEV